MLLQMTGLTEFSLLSGGRRFVPRKVCSESVFFTAAIAGKLTSSILKRFTWGEIHTSSLLSCVSTATNAFPEKSYEVIYISLCSNKWRKHSEEEGVYEIHVLNYYNILEIRF